MLFVDPRHPHLMPCAGCRRQVVFFKFYAAEGGTRVPLIFSGAGVVGPRRAGAFSVVTDVTPSILDLARVERVEDDSVPVTGRSLMALLRAEAEEVYGADTPVGMEVSGQAALFKGDYKIVRNNPRYGDGIWRLYNLARDPGETRDLAAERADLFSELMADYKAYTETMGVLEMPAGYVEFDQIRANSIRQQVRFHWWVLLIVAVGLAAVAFRVGRFIGKKVRKTD